MSSRNRAISSRGQVLPVDAVAGGPLEQRVVDVGDVLDVVDVVPGVAQGPPQDVEGDVGGGVPHVGGVVGRDAADVHPRGRSGRDRADRSGRRVEDLHGVAGAGHGGDGRAWARRSQRKPTGRGSQRRPRDGRPAPREGTGYAAWSSNAAHAGRQGGHLGRGEQRRELGPQGRPGVAEGVARRRRAGPGRRPAAAARRSPTGRCAAWRPRAGSRRGRTRGAGHPRGRGATPCGRSC